MSSGADIICQVQTFNLASPIQSNHLLMNAQLQFKLLK